MARTKGFRITFTFLFVIMTLMENSSSLTCYNNKKGTEESKLEECKPKYVVCMIAARNTTGDVQPGDIQKSCAPAITDFGVKPGECKNTSVAKMEAEKKGQTGRQIELDLVDPNEVFTVCACVTDKCNEDIATAAASNESKGSPNGSSDSSSGSSDSSKKGSGSSGSAGLYPIPGFLFLSTLIIVVAVHILLGF